MAVACEEETRAILHSTTKGIQDERFAELTSTQPKYTRVIEHVTLTCDEQKRRINKKLEIPEGLAIANVRIQGANWERAFFLIGLQYFDLCLNPSFGNSFFLLDDGYCLPKAKCHNFEIELLKIIPSEDVIVEYDIVESPLSADGHYEFVFKGKQYCGPETVLSPVSKLRLHFNHPVGKLIAKFQKPVEKIEFHVPIEGVETYILPFTKVSDTEFILDFGEKTVNFSRIDKCLAVITSDGGENTVTVCAHSRNIARGRSGMYGLAYSK